MIVPPKPQPEPDEEPSHPPTTPDDGWERLNYDPWEASRWEP
jgi:hypothetical protein